jgi:phage head maturation protease
VEHRRVSLRGVGLVPVPAYASARVTRLLDRQQAGRQREANRRRAIERLRAMNAGA